MSGGAMLKNSTAKGRKGGKVKQKVDNLPYMAKINSEYQKHELKVRFEKGFSEKQDINDDKGAVLFSEPFQCCKLPNFVKDTDFLDGLKDELMDQIFIEKNNDLYKFQQTNDLKKLSTPHVKLLKKLIYGDFLDWLRDVTGIPLTDKVDMTCSRYEHTDVLLCHDDELDTRRIAFILYLAPPWKPEDGGCLDLYDMDEHGQPKNIIKSLLPAWNTLSWFEVTEASHHQVSEVFASDKIRLSVNGWFHGPVVPRADRYIEPRRPLYPSQNVEEEIFREWINPIYLDPVVQSQIQEKFEEDSEIELQGFLQDDKYQAVVEALKSKEIQWAKRGPANKRNYYKASEEKVPEIIQQCLTFLQSDAMFLTLSDLTGLSFHKLAHKNVDIVSGAEESDSSDCEEGEGAPPKTGACNDSGKDHSKPDKKRLKLDSDESSTPIETTNMETSVTSESDISQSESKMSTAKCRAEVRHWSQSCYTLVHDTDAEGCEFALDAMLFCACKGWQPEYGGFVSYIAKGEDEELLTVNPAENALALVYRDKDTLRFVKHINSRINEMQNDPEFYDFSLTYYE